MFPNWVNSLLENHLFFIPASWTPRISRSFQDLPGGERRTEFSESSSHRGYKLLVAQLFEPRPQVEVEAADAAFGVFFRHRYQVVVEDLQEMCSPKIIGMDPDPSICFWQG